jgi:site-specific recombinase XerD
MDEIYQEFQTVCLAVSRGQFSDKTDFSSAHNILKTHLRRHGTKKARTRDQTYENYLSALRIWFRYCSSNRLDPLTVTRDNTVEFIAYLQEQPGRRSNTIKDSSIRTYLTGLGIFYTALVDSPLFTSKNPFVYNDVPKGKRPNKPEMRPAHYEKIKEHLSNLSDPLTLRNRLMLTLMAEAGCRAQDIINLNWDHVDTKHQHIDLLNRKGGIDTLQHPLSDASNDLIKLYLPVRDAYAADGEKALFINIGEHVATSYQGKRITKMTLQRVGEKVYQQAGLPKTTTGIHILRALYGQVLYDTHQDLYLVNQVMEHGDIGTTARHYLKPSKTKIRNAVKSWGETPDRDKVKHELKQLLEATSLPQQTLKRITALLELL